MIYDVLCLKSILGFLLLERTFGVSPVIFTFDCIGVRHESESGSPLLAKKSQDTQSGSKGSSSPKTPSLNHLYRVLLAIQ